MNIAPENFLTNFPDTVERQKQADIMLNVAKEFGLKAWIGEPHGGEIGYKGFYIVRPANENLSPFWREVERRTK